MDAFIRHSVVEVPAELGATQCVTAKMDLRPVRTPHSRTIDRDHGDPHALMASAFLVFTAYSVARDWHSKLLNRTIGEQTVLDHLRNLAPNSAFEFSYVAAEAFKFINPRGHGANSARFNCETLGWFQHEYPNDSHLTSGLILMVCAAKWWTHEQGQRSIIPRANPLTSSDLDFKLKSFGFLSGERRAICRMLRWRPRRK